MNHVKAIIRATIDPTRKTLQDLQAMRLRITEADDPQGHEGRELLQDYMNQAEAALAGLITTIDTVTAAAPEDPHPTVKLQEKSTNYVPFMISYRTERGHLALDNIPPMIKMPQTSHSCLIPVRIITLPEQEWTNGTADDTLARIACQHEITVAIPVGPVNQEKVALTLEAYMPPAPPMRVITTQMIAEAVAAVDGTDGPLSIHPGTTLIDYDGETLVNLAVEILAEAIYQAKQSNQKGEQTR